MADDFISVTESGGEPVSQAQVDRLYQRYGWAGTWCVGKDVAEFGCGTGTGLAYLQSISRSLVAADISAEVLAKARAHYGDRIALHQFSAESTPFADESLDVLIMFEAIYYLPDVDAFFREAHRLLRPGGHLLIATANKDLPDFNPSPYSRTYLNPPEYQARLGALGFGTRFFGGSPVAPPGLVSRALRLAKRLAVRLGLIPKTMKGKRFLKRLVFGKLVQLPKEFTRVEGLFVPPVPIAAVQPDLKHQVIYCLAIKD